MKRIAMVLALVAMGACQKQEQKPAAATPPDTSHMMMADTSKGMMMADTSKHMMMADTSKKMMAPAAKPAAKPAPKKKP
ncbi:MAG TPA: hypothetical protein VGV12_13715 [Gemmatimonadales bacterium]|nr:hypothetical protein [Gemmatimonadales bacterium]